MRWTAITLAFRRLVACTPARRVLRVSVVLEADKESKVNKAKQDPQGQRVTPEQQALLAQLVRRVNEGQPERSQRIGSIRSTTTTAPSTIGIGQRAR